MSDYLYAALIALIVFSVLLMELAIMRLLLEMQEQNQSFAFFSLFTICFVVTTS
jgi:hypothetical protein